VCVVGSGAGGGTLAAVAARAGVVEPLGEGPATHELHRVRELVLAAAKKDAEENPNVDLAAGLPLEPEVQPADELEEQQP
jgi:flavin-dependent dehydrogenase